MRSDVTISLDSRLDHTAVDQESYYSVQLRLYTGDMLLTLGMTCDDAERLSLDLKEWSRKREAERIKREALENGQCCVHTREEHHADGVCAGDDPNGRENCRCAGGAA